MGQTALVTESTALTTTVGLVLHKVLLHDAEDVPRKGTVHACLCCSR